MTPKLHEERRPRCLHTTTALGYRASASSPSLRRPAPYLLHSVCTLSVLCAPSPTAPRPSSLVTIRNLHAWSSQILTRRPIRQLSSNIPSRSSDLPLSKRPCPLPPPQLHTAATAGQISPSHVPPPRPASAPAHGSTRGRERPRCQAPWRGPLSCVAGVSGRATLREAAQSDGSSQRRTRRSAGQGTIARSLAKAREA